jgi:hypothetical protein
MKMTIKSVFGDGRRDRRIALGAFVFLSVLCALSASTAARANPRPLPFTYPYETLPEGSVEMELYGDMTPLRVLADPADATKGRLWEPSYRLQTEFEYGLTDHTELGFYQVFAAEAQDGGNNALRFDGFKWRVRHRFAEAGEWPVDVAIYFELETMHDELSLEEKLLLSKRFGRLRWMANLWIEQTMVRPYDDAQRALEFILNPTTGLTYQVTPTFHPGVEYWARGEIAPGGDGAEHVNRTLHHFVGPATHLNFGRLWWSAGVYANLNNFGRPQLGETYGPIWFRTVLGLDL